MMRGIVAVLLAAFVTVWAYTAVAQEVAPSDRVVRNVVVRSGPGTDYGAIDRLSPGEVVQYLGEQPGWYNIALPDGRIGFVSKAWTILTGQEEGLLPVDAGAWSVHVIDIGTGLAVFVEGPDFTLLYDGGSQDDLAMGLNNRILAYIDAVRPGLETLDHIVLSHPHKDHLELLPDVFDRFAVRHVWESGRVNRTVGYCRFLRKVAAEPGVTYHDAIASGATRTVRFTANSCNGDVVLATGPMMTAAPVALGHGARMTMLYRDAYGHHDPNGNSVVVLLELGGRRVLLTGDAEGGDRESPSSPPRPDSIEGRLLACCRAELRSDAVVVGHHGSLTSSRDAFIEPTGARIFAISSGPYAYSSVVLPDEEVVAALSRGGRQVLRTDRDDAACMMASMKIGPDSDESPGGCDNIVMRISAGRITAGYDNRHD